MQYSDEFLDSFEKFIRKKERVDWLDSVQELNLHIKEAVISAGVIKADEINGICYLVSEAIWYEIRLTWSLPPRPLNIHLDQLIHEKVRKALNGETGSVHRY